MSDILERQQVFPQYQCHKKVRALKIADVRTTYWADTIVKNGALLVPEDPRFESFRVSLHYVERHRPVRGGYYVLYEDGYESFSPPEAFESGYTLMSR